MNAEQCPCKVCGQPTRMTGTKLCDPCWEVTHRLKGFVVLNTKSNGFCYFETLEGALIFYHDGIQRGEPYVLLGMIWREPWTSVLQSQ